MRARWDVEVPSNPESLEPTCHWTRSSIVLLRSISASALLVGVR